MIIGIDGNEANVTRRVGISEFAYELIREFSERESEKRKYRIYLKDQPLEHFPKKSSHWSYQVFGPRKLWTQFGLPLKLYTERRKPDVFFTPTHYSPRFSPVPTVVSVMDLSYIHFPHLFKSSDLYQLKNWTGYSVKRARRVITISNSSKNDIIKEYKVSEEKVEVIYPGIKPIVTLEPNIYSMQLLKEKYHIADKYILFVGTLQPRKNIVRLIKAFSKVVNEAKERDMQLVVVGKKGWLFDEIIAAPEKYDVEGHVLFLDFVPDEDLPALYKHAQCYVLPSLYEGFGLPVLEAMKYNCPVITSNVSSLPEAGGDAALYVDPENVDDIAEKIRTLLENKSLREDLIEKGKVQVKKFSWEKTAKETLNVLEQVAGKV